MKIDTLFTYRDMIALLEHHPDLCRLECAGTVQCATDAVRLKELADDLVPFVKDALTFAEHPFDEAVIDNLEKSTRDLATAMQVSLYQCEGKFDARDLLNPDILRNVVETMFRCTMAIKTHQGLSVPTALVLLDNVVRDALLGSLEVLLGNKPGEWESFVGKTRIQDEPFMTFELLEKQKYFTTAERQQIEDAKHERERAVEEAARKANEQREFHEASSLIESVLGIPKAELSDKLAACVMPVARLLLMNTINKDDVSDPFVCDKSIVLNKDTRSGDLAYLLQLISHRDKREISFVSCSTRSTITKADVGNDCPLEANDILEVVVD